MVTLDKHVGEQDSSELEETLMNPATRNVLKITVGDVKKAEELIDCLFGTNVPPRREYLLKHSEEAKTEDEYSIINGNEIDICEEIHQNFLDFSYETNSRRSFPSVVDGLKPGARMALWEMYIKKYFNNKPHIKSAKVSGSIVAHLHPHSPTAIYDTFVRMSQKWIENMPEVDFHGGNGSPIISAEASSERYTEVRLSKEAEEGLLQGINKNNVPMTKNFLEDEDIPVVLPAIVPRLLVNGSMGIGSTISNCWLLNNLKECIDVIEDYVRTGILNYDNLYPDFPSGGVIINKKDIKNIYDTGKGKVILRGKVEIKNNIILITEIPYQVYVEPLIDEIKKLVLNDTIPQIEEINNKSKDEILIEIKCEKDTDLTSIVNNLYQKTSLQRQYNANQYALVGKTPMLLNLKGYLDYYIEHNINCIKAEYQFDLDKAKNRKEIVDGLIRAQENIDKIIELIKNSKSSSDAEKNLMDTYNFTERQAKSIVDMRLGKLANLEKVELNSELQGLQKTIDDCNDILLSVSRQKDIFLSRLVTFGNKYKKPRKTLIIDLEEEIKESKTKKENKKVNVILDSKWNLKIGQKPTSGTVFFKDVSYLLIFTNLEKYYKINIEKLNDKPIGITSLISLRPGERIISVLSPELDKKYIMFFTKKGMIKKTEFAEYLNLKRESSIALKLKDNDEVVSIVCTNDDKNIVVKSQKRVIKFETKNIKAIGRATAGVKAIKLDEDDFVLIGDIASKKEDEELNIQERGGKGIKRIDI